MPHSKTPGWIDWVNSATQEIILEDLEPPRYLFEKDDIPASVVWEHYKNFQSSANLLLCLISFKHISKTIKCKQQED
eukprot:2318005-Ditylum_brightwellii.AAC.1